jgi:multiple sugar transport system ATP-binding protein
VSTVELRQVFKRYDGDVTAVQDLSLTIEDGEFCVLVGPSGCGKTTTLRMVAGLESITGGDLLIGGRRVNEVAPRDRDIAMVFQSYALYPHMTVYENMAFGLRLRKIDKREIERRVTDAATTLGLEELLKRKPKALSGGQRQRVAMGRAIVRAPKVFLFDEPLSNLDAKLRHEMRLEIARLHKRLSATTLYVTHDQVEAMTLADRLAILDRGVLQQYGPPLELYNHPINRFVAGFLGSPSMNFLVGEPVSDTCFRGPGFELTLRPGPTVGTVGIRPQDFRLDPDGPLTASVELIEPLGSESFIHFHWGDASVVAKIPPDVPVARGDTLRLSVDSERIHRFDEQGRTL